MERTYAHIDLDERRKIARWRAANLSVDIIAEKLGRHRSTVFRELKRNRFVDDQITDLTGYYWSATPSLSVMKRSISLFIPTTVEKKGFGNICLNVVPDDVHVMPGAAMDVDFRRN